MSQALLELYLRKLKLWALEKHYAQIIEVNTGCDNIQLLLKLFEREVQTREENAINRKIKGGNFPKIKTLDSYEFECLPHLDREKVLTFTNCDFIEKAENIIMLGNSGTGKTHLAIALGVAVCHKNISVYFTSAAKLANDLMEARHANTLSKLHGKLAKYRLLIIDEIGYVPLSQTGAELMYDVINQRYEISSLIVTSNLQLSDWGQIFKCEKLTNALLDRLTHHSHILDMNGESYRFSHSTAHSQN